MTPLLYHCQEAIELDRLVRDGQFDAMILESLFVKSETLYLIRHGLGRPVKQYQLVFSDKPIRFPGCARDALTGLQLNDNDQIGLIFTESNATVRLRFA
jgi:hypothetical protein